MIITVDTWDGVTTAGAAVIRKLYEHCRKTYPDVPVEWVTKISGKFGTHFAVIHYPSLAAAEEFSKKWNADEGVKRIMKEAAPGPHWTSRSRDFYSVQE